MWGHHSSNLFQVVGWGSLTALGSLSLTASDSVVWTVWPTPLNNTLDSPHLSSNQKVCGHLSSDQIQYSIYYVLMHLQTQNQSWRMKNVLKVKKTCVIGQIRACNQVHAHLKIYIQSLMKVSHYTYSTVQRNSSVSTPWIKDTST